MTNNTKYFNNYGRVKNSNNTKLKLSNVGFSIMYSENKIHLEWLLLLTWKDILVLKGELTNIKD